MFSIGTCINALNLASTDLSESTTVTANLEIDIGTVKGGGSVSRTPLENCPIHIALTDLLYQKPSAFPILTRKARAIRPR